MEGNSLVCWFPLIRMQSCMGYSPVQSRCWSVLVVLLIVTGVPQLIAEEQVDFSFFERRIRPVLTERCYRCHLKNKDNKSGLMLDSRRALFRGGRSGPALVDGDPGASLLIRAIRHEPSVASMPPDQKLSKSEVQAFVTWVRQGSPWPKNEPTTRSLTNPNQSNEFWSFQPVTKPAVPGMDDSAWVRSPVDAFVLKGLQASGLKPVPPADRRQLIRRATLDLHGVLPSPDSVNAFVKDLSPRAFETLIERLLASPRYGERWARRWMDVVRYADSNGMDDNMTYADAWRYRDYLVQAFNEDKPYDHFVREQIAGDLMSFDDPDAAHHATVATGFLMIGPKMLAEDDPVKQRMDIIDDQLDTLGRAFMGLTIGCARCHDHKFDPISTEDYYGLAGIFLSTRVMLSYRVDSKWNSIAGGTARGNEKLEQLERELDRLDAAVVLGDFVGKAEEKKALTDELARVKEQYAAIPKIMATEDDRVQDLEVFLGGNHLTRGDLVERRFPSSIFADQGAFIPKDQSGRLQLADWMTHPDHPLTTRVIVNRIWQALFQEPLVRSPDNFGRLGQMPDNAALLDWLAREFVDSGWSIKDLCRRIMLTNTYQMSSVFQRKAYALDPDNRMQWRHNRRRMQAEELRDSLLSVSGQIDLMMGGAVFESDKILVILSASSLKDPSLFESKRRSVYLPVLRSGVYDVFSAFDFPDPAVVNGRRGQTTVAPQALFMMNDMMVHEAARLLARDSAETVVQDRFEDRLTTIYMQVYSRFPTSQERLLWKQFIDRYPNESHKGRNLESAWEAVVRVLLASNEFVYVD